MSREQAQYCRVAIKQVSSSLTHTPSSGIEMSYNVCDYHHPRRLADQTVMYVRQGEIKEANNGSSNYQTLATRMGELGPRINAAYCLTLCEWYG